MNIVFAPDAWEDFLLWQSQHWKTVKRINSLIEDIVRNGHEGIGKPEPLRSEYHGYWSRRINDEHRLVYQLTEDRVLIASCRLHYN